jgi:hypothetical protein
MVRIHQGVPALLLCVCTFAHTLCTAGQAWQEWLCRELSDTWTQGREEV